MKPVRFVFLTLAVFGGLSALYFCACRVAVRQPLGSYDTVRNLHVVKDRLAAETLSPRWLIVGGSSAWFGLNSGALAAASGQPVTNLGNHAELPIWFQLWQAEQHLRAGDTVLLAAEMVHFRREGPTTFGAIEVGLIAPEYFWATSWRRRRDLLGAVPPSHVLAGLLARFSGGSSPDARPALPSSEQLMSNLRARWAGTFAGEVPDYYNYLELDQHGDFTRARPPATHGRATYELKEPLRPPIAAWSELQSFAERMQARGVRCLFTWPPFERHAGIDYAAPLAQVHFAEVRDRMSAAGWREVGTPEDSILETESFYDTPYHLTTEGARLRTTRLLERLRAAGLITPAPVKG